MCYRLDFPQFKIIVNFDYLLLKCANLEVIYAKSKKNNCEASMIFCKIYLAIYRYCNKNMCVVILFYLQVATLDIDICGPSQPRMLGVLDKQVHQSGSGWSPVVCLFSYLLPKYHYLLFFYYNFLTPCSYSSS